MYFIEIEEDILNEIIFKLREKDLIQLSNELIDSIDMDFEPEKYVEESEDYEKMSHILLMMRVYII